MAQLHIATWNLDHPFSKKSKGTRKKMRNMLQAHAADVDILVLTETDEQFQPPGYTRISATTPRENSDENERWTMIWAKNDSNPNLLMDIDTFDTSRTTCSVLRVKNIELMVYGTVLPWVGSAWCGFDATVSFHKALKVQAYEWRLFQQEMSLPLVIAGDFNQDLWEWHYYGSKKNKELLKKELFNNALKWDWNNGYDPVVEMTDCHHAAIDHVFVSKQFEITRKSAWSCCDESGKQLTDHFGSLVEVGLVTS